MGHKYTIVKTLQIEITRTLRGHSFILIYLKFEIKLLAYDLKN